MFVCCLYIVTCNNKKQKRKHVIESKRNECNDELIDIDDINGNLQEPNCKRRRLNDNVNINMQESCSSVLQGLNMSNAPDLEQLIKCGDVTINFYVQVCKILWL